MIAVAGREGEGRQRPSSYLDHIGKRTPQDEAARLRQQAATALRHGDKTTADLLAAEAAKLAGLDEPLA